MPIAAPAPTSVRSVGPDPYDEVHGRAVRETVNRQDLGRLRGMIDRGLPLNGNRYSEPPLMRAISTGWTDGVRALLAAGIDLHIEHQDRVALHVATLQHRGDYMTMLINAGADLNRRTRTGNTALHEAFSPKPVLKLVKLLLDAGADPNALSKFGRTPLSLAMDRADSPRLVQALGKAGADPTVRDADGRTAMDVLNARSRVPPAMRLALNDLVVAHVAHEQQVLREAMSTDPAASITGARRRL